MWEVDTSRSVGWIIKDRDMTVSFANPLGIMQGRLLPPVGNRIQVFPENGWQKEFHEAAELELDCIEFIFEGENYFNHPLISEKGVSEIQRLEKETGVTVLSVCADYFMEHTLHRSAEENVNKNAQVLSELITSCSRFSVRDIIIPCVDSSRFLSEEEKERFVASLSMCLPLAEKHGVHLCLETDLAPESFRSLLEKFTSPCLKVNYDIGNSASLGYNPEEEFSAYGEYITDVHIKDRILHGGTVPLGKGNANFPAVFKKLKELKFTGIFVFQTARQETGKEQETIKEYISFVKPFLS